MSTLLNKNSEGIFPHLQGEDLDLTGSTPSNRLTILAIESSCDETAVAIVKMDNGIIIPLSNLVSSQIALHAQWGGVVPNLAAREHLNNITPLISKSFTDAGIEPKDLDAIAVTNGPGLIPALLVGADFAKTISYLWKKPLIGIHHIEGHIYANFVTDKNSVISNNQFPISKQDEGVQFPALALVVSGGHTQLVFMKDHLQYEIIGQTLDDAVGEAFDKVARILGIGYPGGPAVALRAQNFQFPISNFQKNSKDSKTQIPNDKIEARYNIKLPRPMLNKNNYDFSFSGLKTAVLYETKKNPDQLKNEGYVNAVCREFQQACIDVLVSKTVKATEAFKPKTILLAGGVSANKELRKQLGEAIEKTFPHVTFLTPDISLTGDNATMIGAAACIRWDRMNDEEKNAAKENWKTLNANANLKLE